MKLLIVTQKADRRDPILGFFHRWLTEFAGQTEALTVVAQGVGDRALPQNVHVLSLGKERGTSTLRQILRFWSIIWGTRHAYDRVFVHMTPVWVLLGWPVWAVLRKPVYLWYEIRRGSFKLTLALLCVRKVFSATVQGLPYAHRKQVVCGHGIDTAQFAPDNGQREGGLAVAAGRLTRSKNYDIILRAFAQVPALKRLRIAGGTVTARDQEEKAMVERLMRELNIAERVETGWVAPAEMPSFLCRADLLLHACIGGLDKVVLEAMACGTPVVSTSGAVRGILPDICLAQPETMADHAQQILSLPPADREALAQNLRKIVEDHHSLPRLIARLVTEMS